MSNLRYFGDLNYGGHKGIEVMIGSLKLVSVIDYGNKKSSPVRSESFFLL